MEIPGEDPIAAAKLLKAETKRNWSKTRSLTIKGGFFDGELQDNKDSSLDVAELPSKALTSSLRCFSGRLQKGPGQVAGCRSSARATKFALHENARRSSQMQAINSKRNLEGSLFNNEQ